MDETENCVYWLVYDIFWRTTNTVKSPFFYLPSMVLLPEFDMSSILTIGLGLKVGEPETTKCSSLAENHMMPGWSIIRQKRSGIRFLHSTPSSSSVCNPPFIIFHWKQVCSMSPSLLADCNKIKIMPRKLMALRAHLLSLGIFMIVLSYHRFGRSGDFWLISKKLGKYQ